MGKGGSWDGNVENCVVTTNRPTGVRTLWTPVGVQPGFEDIPTQGLWNGPEGSTVTDETVVDQVIGDQNR